jgi:hypothetical protein
LLCASEYLTARDFCLGLPWPFLTPFLRPMFYPFILFCFLL